MANETHITIRGNLGKDPVKYGEENVSARFNVAVSVVKFVNEKWVQHDAQWFRVKAFGPLAVNVLESLRKGDPVIVHGELRTEFWKDDAGQQVSAPVLVAHAVGPDLRRVQAKIIRVATNQALASATDFEPASPSDPFTPANGTVTGAPSAVSGAAVTDSWDTSVDVSQLAPAPESEVNVA